MLIRFVFPRVVVSLSLFSAVLWLSGCGGDDTESTDPASDPTSATESSSEGEAVSTGQTSAPKKPRGPIQLGGGTTAANGENGTTAKVRKPHNINDVIAALKPLQIVMGKWEGVFSRGGVGETHDWVWDLKTDKKHPALALSAPEGNYFTSARITFDPATDKYKMKTVDAEKVVREFEGGWEAEPTDEPGDDGKTLHRKFKLKLTELPGKNAERWEFIFSQQNNNRYQMTASRARGTSPRFTQRNVLGAQRSGTSFAQASDDYGDRTCVISQGLGTISVSYQGKSYFVCCSGCKAAFEDDPAMWIERFEKLMAEKKKS
jgi:hypothetical protein